MARPIVLSNGSMHVGINTYGLVHDVYYPYVGLENHTIGRGLRHKIGVWVDGELSWLDDGAWEIRFSYPHFALIGHITARCDRLGIVLEFDDTVDAELSVLLRNIHVVNLENRRRDVRLFLHQAFVIGDSRGNTDTAQFLPDSHAIMHYRGRRVFIVSAEADGTSFDQHTVGLFGIENHEGSWRDAEDGELSGNNVEHGRVDSVMRIRASVDGLSSFRVRYWLAAGTTMREAISVHKRVRDGGFMDRYRATADWWHTWLAPAIRVSESLPRPMREELIRGAMILRAHIDNRGAIIASTDSGMLNYGRDAYAYCWPRDGAYVLWPLMRLGYTKELIAFFDFCRRVMHPRGYLSHKYRADDALGSSWHSYVQVDRTAPPIQSDETALVLFLFAQYYQQQNDKKVLAEYYDSLVRPMASFLASYVDKATHLPEPSYDLWEEHFMTTTYTTAVTQAALSAAADLAEITGDEASAVLWRTVADDMYQAAKQHLYSEDRSVLRKGFRYNTTGIEYDDTIDMSAIFGAFMYGLFDVESPEVRASIVTAMELFDQRNTRALPATKMTIIDEFRRRIRSNFWHITTLWYAQYCIEIGDVGTAEGLIDWVRNHRYDSCILSEQIVPSSQASTSVAPLAWSHAEYVATLLDYVAALGDDA